MTAKRVASYVALALFFAFTAAAFYSHFTELPTRAMERAGNYRVPFVSDGRIVYVGPQAQEAGLKIGDRVVGVNGHSLDSDSVYAEELERARMDGGTIELSVTREKVEGPITVSVPMIRVERNVGYYLRSMAGYLYNYGLPLMCALLGFWVVLVRPTDYLAWLLLFLLLGVASLGMEGFGQSRVLSSFRAITMSGWGLSMFLFGVYFPERLEFERKIHWFKWLIIVPLCYQLLLVLAGQFKQYTGVGLLDFLEPVNQVVVPVLFFINMLAIGLFFSLLGWKSGTLENSDARRRLRMMWIGTMIAITPFFLLVIYKIATGAPGSFYDVAPGWIAFIALCLTLLFPLTMAYVIVVHRAMDVSVVVRQGLQYALAKGGVRVIQMLLLVGIGLLVWWSINRYGANISTQIAFIVGGVALVPLVDMVAKPLRLWIDRRFFREAYNAEQILSELSEDVRTMVETEPLLKTVAGRISESLHVPQVALLLKNGSSFVPEYAVGFDTPPPVELPTDSRAIKKLAANRHIVLYDDMTEVTSVPTVSLNEMEQLKELNSQVLLPLAAKNELTGIISLSPKRSEEPYTASDLRLLRSVATQTAFALENSRLTEAVAREAAQKERLNAELEIAREVQERLFPQELPKIQGIDYFGSCRPALGVGGDYYDFLELADGKFGLAIGDVSGKGIGASLMMASLQASLRGQALHAGDDLATLMSNVNTLVYEASTTNRYATFFYGQYDPRTMVLNYVNAGHNPPFVIRTVNGSEVIRLETGGPVVGMLPSMLARYEQGEVQLQPGDVLVGFTDGISEAMNPDEEEWGEDALLEELKGITGKCAREIIDEIVAAADRFANGAKQHDDMTMIVVRVMGPDAE